MTIDWKQAIENKRECAIQFAKNRTLENSELKKKHIIGTFRTLRPRNAGKQLRLIGLKCPSPKFFYFLI